MFCPNCGTDNPNGAFCKNCGTPLSQPVTPTYTSNQSYQPAYTNPYPQAPYAGPVLAKGDYLKTAASEKCKKISLYSLVLTAILVLAMLGSYFLVMNTSAEKIPLVSFGMKASDDNSSDEFDRLMNNLRGKIQQGRYELEMKQSAFAQSDVNLLNRFFNAAEKCADTFSIHNVRKMLKITEDVADSPTLSYDMASVGNISNDIDKLEDILDTASSIIFVFLGIALFFTALGGFLKVRGLVIAGLIFSLIYSIIFCPVYALVIIVILHIALIVMLSNILSEYKAYSRSLGIC